jgi:hypothetical protein
MGVLAILFAIAVAAIVVGLAAAARRVSPWWLLLAASVAAVPIYVVAQITIARSCDTTRADVAPFWFTAACVLAGLTLFGAAAVAGVADGVRQARAGEHGAAVARAVLVPALSAAGALFVLFEILSAALHCD